MLLLKAERMTPITLFVPAPFDQVSGGYGYDRRMVAELRAPAMR